jgi:hypothetical protein
MDRIKASVRYLPTVVAWIGTAMYLAVAYTYKPAPRAMPLLIGWAVWVLLSLDLAAMTPTMIGRNLTSWLNPARDQDDRAVYPAARQLAALGSIAALTTGLILIGILPAVALYVFGVMRFFGRRPYRVAALTTAAVTLFVWLMLAQVLRIDLYPGLIFERLVGE